MLCVAKVALGSNVHGRCSVQTQISASSMGGVDFPEARSYILSHINQHLLALTCTQAKTGHEPRTKKIGQLTNRMVPLPFPEPIRVDVKAAFSHPGRDDAMTHTSSSHGSSNADPTEV